MTEIILATTNKNKIKDFKKIFENDFKILTLEDINLNVDVEEDGQTFEENAKKKAYEIMKITNKICLGDDSGLEVDFLDKKPGIYSSRFMGKETSNEIKNNEILRLLKDVKKEKRTARFICSIAIAFPDFNVISVTETLEGFINNQPKGENGFGYDPIFFVENFNKTFAELSFEEKSKHSHRAKAVDSIKKIFYDYLKNDRN